MAKEPTTQRIAGKELVCPICSHAKFTQRRALLSRRGLALFDLEWIGKRADTYICARCGYVYWFVPVKKD